jgi:hypothetical protein
MGATSVIAALHQASQQGSFNYEVSDNWFPGMGFFITSINDEPGSGAVGWSYRVWNDDYAAVSQLSVDAFMLGYSGMPIDTPHNEVLWYWGGVGSGLPLRVTTDKGTAGVSEEITATVQYFRDEGWTGTGTWEGLDGATLSVGSETFVTDSSGQVTLFLEDEGNFTFSTEKLFDGSDYYVPSDDQTTVSISGGDTADWWVQTTQGEFSGGSTS